MKIYLKFANLVKKTSIEYGGKYKVISKHFNVFKEKEEKTIEMEKSFDFELEGKIYQTNNAIKGGE